MSKTRIPITTDPKTGYTSEEEREMTEIIDRIFTREEEPATPVQEPLKIIALMVSPEQVEALLSVLVQIDPLESDREFVDLVAHIVGPLLVAGYDARAFEMLATSRPGSFRVVKRETKTEGNENGK